MMQTMKDSTKNLMDKQLANKGWVDMQKLLDRDMPIQRKRHRGFIWMVQLAAALLIPVMGIAAWHWHAEKTLSHQKTLVVEGDNKHYQPTHKSAEQNSAVSTHHDVLLNTHAATPLPTLVPGQNTTSSAQRDYSPATDVKAPYQPNAAEQLQAQAYTTPDPTPNLHTTVASTFPTLQQTKSMVAPLYPRTVVLPNTLDMPDAAANVEPQAVQAPQAPWAFGAVAGVQSSTDFKGLNGVVAGLSVDYHLNRHFGIRSGLNYQAFQPDNSERPIASISAASYTHATGSEDFFLSNFGPLTADVQVNVPLARLHRVEAPLLAYWQPLTMLRVFGGIRLGYNLYAQSAQRAQTEFGSFDTPKGGSDERALNRSVGKTISKWEPSWTSGLGIGIGKRAEIGLFYNLPWYSKKQEENQEVILSGPTTNAGNAILGNTNASSFQLSATVFF